MKFSSKSDVLLVIGYTITVLWITTCPAVVSGLPDPHPNSSPDSSDHLSNADLHHLLSLLDGSVSDQPSPANPQNLMDDLDVGASELFAVTAQPTTTTTDVPTTVNPTLSTTTRRIIRRTRTTTQRTTTTNTPEPTQSTTTTTVIPIAEPTTSPSIRREDNQIENLRALVPPSQHELVQQLSLLNSLLTSLGENATVETPVATAASKKDNEQAASEIHALLASIAGPNNSSNTSAGNKTTQVPEDPAAALQSLALLNSLFGGSSASPGNANSNAAAAALLGLGNLGPSNIGTRQAHGGNTQPEADATAALTALLQSASLGAQNGKTSPAGNLQNFQNTNGNMDAAASNQISSLISLLGTLGSLGQPQQSNSIFNLGQTNPVSQQQNNFLANLLGGSQQQQPQANALGNLFGAASQPQGQSVNLGNFLFPSQNPSPGLGLLSTMGSLGSSLFSTVSNVLGGSGSGGKPRVRGKGVDTRLGLGYRFGDAADAQIVWDIGPQLFTDPLRNEARPPMMKSKSQQVHEQNYQSQARVEKQQQIAAAKRLLQLQMHHEIQNSQFLQRRLSNTLSTKKPLSLLDMWNSGRYKQSVASSRTQIPQQLMIPPSFMNNIDPLRVFRRKSFMKRSSGPDLMPYFKDKPFDDPLDGHSTLTTYEKMLLKHGNEFGLTGGSKRKPEPSSDNFHAPSEQEHHRHEDHFEGPPYKKVNNPPQPSSYDMRNANTKNRNRRPLSQHEHDSGDREANNNFQSDRQKYSNNNFDRPSFKTTQNPHRFKPHHTRNSNNDNWPPRPERYHQDNESETSSKRENYNNFENNSKQNMEGRPRRRPNNPQGKDGRRRNPGFSLRNIFRMRRKPSSGRGKPPRPEANRRVDSNPQFQDFTNTNSDMLMADSNDRFRARNNNVETGYKSRPRQPQNSFIRKISKGRPRAKLLHKEGDELVHSSSSNPEADDSFIRRNAVASNPALREVEKQKLFSIKARNSSAVVVNVGTKREDMVTEEDTPASPQKKSVMNYIRNFLSSKPKSKSSHNSSSSSITSLKNFFSDPSSLNPMKILPIRRRNRPKPSAPKTRLTMVDGRPQIVEATNATPKAEEESKPIVHVGEDMSFEDLTQLFGSTKNATKGKNRKKLKSKKTKTQADSRKDDELEIERVYRLNKEDEKKSKEIQDDEEYEDDDGLKGIFIDIDSGEVNVLKPVASLTSFEPKKESEEEEVDEYEDEDGDGIADADMKRKQEIFQEIQKELKRNYNKMKKTQERADAKKRRKEDLVAKGMDESVDHVSKYFDMLEDPKDTKKREKFEN